MEPAWVSEEEDEDDRRKKNVVMYCIYSEKSTAETSSYTSRDTLVFKIVEQKFRYTFFSLSQICSLQKKV